jgi:restriction endonuclease S subunit
MQRNSSGSVVRAIQTQRLREFTIEVPSLDAQRSIADQLAAVDDELAAYRAAASASLRVREALSAVLFSTDTSQPQL